MYHRGTEGAEGVLHGVLGELAGCFRGTPGVLSAVLKANSVDTQGGTHGTPAVLGCTLEYSGAHTHACTQSSALSRERRDAYLRPRTFGRPRTRARASDLHRCRSPSVVGSINSSADAIVQARKCSMSLSKNVCGFVRVHVSVCARACVSVCVCARVCASVRVFGLVVRVCVFLVLSVRACARVCV